MKKIDLPKGDLEGANFCDEQESAWHKFLIEAEAFVGKTAIGRTKPGEKVSIYTRFVSDIVGGLTVGVGSHIHPDDRVIILSICYVLAALPNEYGGRSKWFQDDVFDCIARNLMQIADEGEHDILAYAIIKLVANLNSDQSKYKQSTIDKKIQTIVDHGNQKQLLNGRV